MVNRWEKNERALLAQTHKNPPQNMTRFFLENVSENEQQEEEELHSLQEKTGV